MKFKQTLQFTSFYGHLNPERANEDLKNNIRLITIRLALILIKHVSIIYKYYI